MHGTWLSGVHSVRAALTARRRKLFELVVCQEDGGETTEALVEAANAAGASVRRLPAGDFGRLAPKGVAPQGCLLRAGELPEPLLEEFCDPPGARTLVAVDGVTDPQNLGALARVAEGAGAAGLVLTRRNSPPLTPAVSRASAGAIEWLPVARVPNLARTLNELKSKEFWVYGADADAADGLWHLPDRAHSARRVVVLGSEGDGLRPGVVRALDFRLSIPLGGRVESLNVATAAAIVLFELRRRDADDPGGNAVLPALPRV